MNEETQRFILDHINDDIHQLALQSAKYPAIDMPLVIRQINGKQKIKSKIPTFFQNANLLYPVQLSLEQSSSESTASYKSTLCEGKTLADLTGGFGVDCYFLSAKFEQVSYVEQNTKLCEIAKHNFKALGRVNIQVFNTSSEEFLEQMPKVDWIFIDPARRSEAGKKTVLLSDCEPDVSNLSKMLLQKATSIMIKLSPMLDITAAVRELPQTSEIHVISVENECKEVLIVLNSLENKCRKIKTINISRNKKEQIFEYNPDNEANCNIEYSSGVEKYLYEPNAAVMKSGLFKAVGSSFSLKKLHINSHLYTSSKLNSDFPGRIFEVVKVWGKDRKSVV